MPRRKPKPAIVDSGEQAGVNCKRCGRDRPMHWRSNDPKDSAAVCRRCGAIEMLFRPTGEASNRAPGMPPTGRCPPDGHGFPSAMTDRLFGPDRK